MHSVLTSAFRLVGALFLYALFLREDEEGKIQNFLEHAWKKIRKSQAAALTLAAAFTSTAAGLTSSALAKLCGRKFFSVRMVGISYCLSIASFLAFPYLGKIFHIVTTLPNPQVSGFVVIPLIMLGFMPAWIEERQGMVFWGVSVFAVFCVSFIPIMILVFRKQGGAAELKFVSFLALALGASLFWDLLYVAFNRWLLGLVSRMKNFWWMLLSILGNAVVMVLLFTGPVFLFLWTASPHPSVVGTALFAAITLNLVDLFFCSWFICIVALLLLHRVFWPLLERPLHTAWRFRVIRDKRLLLLVAALLLIGPSKDMAIAKWLLDLIVAIAQRP